MFLVAALAFIPVIILLWFGLNSRDKKHP